MTRFIIIVTLLVILTLPACENLLLDSDIPKPPLPSKHSSEMANILDSLRYALDFPALSAAIVSDTGIIEAQAVGCRRWAGPVDVTVNDRFQLGSNTKAFTALMTAILVDEGKVGWSTTLSVIFPEYANSMRPEYRNVTVRDLLSHSSGFRRDPDLTLHSSDLRQRRIEVLEWALIQPPAVKKGQALYSNLGYIIAGTIIEKLTNRSYEDNIFQRVLPPLGITKAGIGAMGTPGLEDEPLQHTPFHSPVIPTSNASLDPAYNPAGMLNMPIGDWGRYIQWVLAAEAGHQTLLKPETARMLTSAAVLTEDGFSYYALGWIVVDRSWAGGRTLTHGGSNRYNQSSAWLAPNRKFAVIVAANQGPPGITAFTLDQVAGRLLGYYLYGH